MNPDHLLDLAEQETNPEGVGAPRQAVLRRAVSTAYYAMFHRLLWTTAESFVPARSSLWKSRVLFYRALDHGRTRERCKRLGSNPLGKEEQALFGFRSFSDDLRLFANHFVRLQELRHRCDYDPTLKISKLQARQAVEDAKKAVSIFNMATPDDRTLFISYLLFGIRSP